MLPRVELYLYFLCFATAFISRSMSPIDEIFQLSFAYFPATCYCIPRDGEWATFHAWTLRVDTCIPLILTHQGWKNTITLLSVRGWLTALWVVIGVWGELMAPFY